MSINQDKSTNSGGWFSNWFTSFGNKNNEEEEENEKTLEPTYSKNQQTLSSLRSRKRAASYSNERNLDSEETLVRAETNNSQDTPSAYKGFLGGLLKRKETRRLKLTNNNLVIDSPIPDKLFNVLDYTDQQEFSHIRYTAVTCEPDDFMAQNYTLRPKIYNRETEIFIVMTMYNVN